MRPPRTGDTRDDVDHRLAVGVRRTAGDRRGAGHRRDDGLRVAAVLLGRAGSQALPGKNVMRLLGRPSLHYPLMAARASGVVDALYVSTDSDEIARLAAPFGAQRIVRPARLASHQALLEEAIHWTCQQIEQRGPAPDAYLILLCNAVTVLPDRIRQAARMLAEDASADAVVTAARGNMFSPVRARAVDAAGDRLVSYVPWDVLERAVPVSCDRNQSPPCYFIDHSFTLTRRATVARLPEQPGPFRWMGRHIRFVEQAPGPGDIDLPWQVPVAEWWLREHGFTATRLPYPTPRLTRAPRPRRRQPRAPVAR
jgi:hypothetical protein